MFEFGASAKELALAFSTAASAAPERDVVVELPNELLDDRLSATPFEPRLAIIESTTDVDWLLL